MIPSSFSTQLKDSSDSQGRPVQRDIKIGSNKDERNGAHGQSATQRTCVYKVDIGNTRVRLIDTPGNGDTRGLDQDNRNMADILCVLRTYDKLHGIVILLKPNAARLTVMFRFCIKQLLTHLHKNAAHNIVFGFTNTRGSNYKPGDTFKPLETLLSEYTAIRLGLYSRNVFCFDSESFRYLAARKQGVDIGSVDDNSRSREYSVAESKRLVTYFQGLTPHSVRSTVNLNETRDIIIRLTEPMALIARKFQTSIAVNNDQVATLLRTRLSRVELVKHLYVQRESIESYEVGRPRTVCTHHDCVGVRSDLEGRDEKVVGYKTMCHRPCMLGAKIKRNEKGHPELERCVVMDGGVFWVVCSHHFMDHMHIYYDDKPVTHRHKDEAVDQNLLKNTNDIELQQEAIQMRKTAIEEFEIEYKQVQDAAIHFGFFLKRHAIGPYNDATVEYVDHLIHQERMKIKIGGRADELNRLEKYKSDHLERVVILTKAMESGNTTLMLDDRGVTQLVTGLYGLPHFGADLKRIVENNERVVDAAFREKTSTCRREGIGRRGGRRCQRRRGLSSCRWDPGWLLLRRRSTSRRPVLLARRHPRMPRQQSCHPCAQSLKGGGREFYEQREGEDTASVRGLKCQGWSWWTNNVDFGFPFAHYRLETIHFEDEDGFWIDVDLPLIHFDDVSGATMNEIVTGSTPTHRPRICKMKTLPTTHDEPK